jgi:hypothetical protein
VAAPPFYRVELAGLDKLRPGQSLGLDVVCDGILRGEEFVYPAELVPGGLDSEMRDGA